MLKAIGNLPLLLQLVLIAALAMFVPSIHALAAEDFHIARTFFYAGLLVFIISSLIGIAVSSRTQRYNQRDQLLNLVLAFVLVPAILAIPFQEASRTSSYGNAYFEMVSSFTTTGATLYDMPELLAPSLHLWRATVGWLGGLLIWIVAASMLAPMRLGGFEITGSGPTNSSVALLQRGSGDQSRGYAGRVHLVSLTLAPVYAALTLALWVGLLIAGDNSLVALCHAMSTLATSGISPVGGLSGGTSGMAGEVLVFVFLLPAVSRLVFSPNVPRRLAQLTVDPEFRIALALVIVAPALLFLRHWIGALEFSEQSNFVAGLQALWGSMFTVLSFLTTGGFESVYWEEARNWSGLPSPGVVLICLATVGGGVATTTGGVKLLRCYTLYMHGLREMEKLVHPSSVRAIGGPGRRIHQQGAYLAWLFFMIFALSIAGSMGLLTLAGVGFEEAMVVAVAALSTTGPLTHAVGDITVSYADMTVGAKLVVCVTMILGRLEALALIAVFNPNFWRN